MTAAFNARHKTKVNGGPTKKMSAREIAFHKTMQKALGGDQKAFAFLLQFDQPDGPPVTERQPMEAVELSAAERAILCRQMTDAYRAEGHTEEQIAGLLDILGLGPDGEDL